MGDLHNRSWKARHLEVLEQQCGQDTGKWCRALSKLAREGKRVHMEAVLNRMVVLGRPVKGAFIRMFLDCCLASKNTVQAYEYLEKFSAHSPLHRDLYLHALKICGAVGDPSTASLLLELMRVRGVSPCSAAIRSHMTAFSTAGDVPRALSVLRSLRDHPPPHSSAMREASQQLPVPLPLQAADEVLRSAGVTLTDCNKMLQACVPAKDFPTALRIFKLVLAKGLVPCSYTWGAMVQVAAKTGQPERGLELLRTMLSDQQQRPPPSAHCFNHLLTAFSKVGNSGKFEEVLSLMMAAAVPLDEFSYSIMFSSVANGVLRGDSAVFTEHFRSVPPPTSRTPLGCSRDASPLPVTSEGEEALQSSATCMYEPPTEALVAHMLGRGLMLANHCWRVASAPYSKEGNHAGLKRLMTLVISFDPTERQGNSNRRGDGGGQSAKRTRKCTGGESAKNSASWKQLRFSMLRDCLGCLGKLGLADHAYALLRVSGNQRASPSEPLRDEQNCWLRVIRAYAEGQGDWRRALGVLDDMRAQGYEMTPLLWRYVLQQCAASEGAAELVALLRRCYQEDGILPDKEGWALLMAALDRPVSRVQDELASAAGGALLVTSDHSATTDFVYEANILKDFIKVCPVAVQQLIVASVVRHMTYVSRCPRWQITEFASACKGLRNVADRDLSSAVNKMLPSKMPDWSLHDTAPRTPLSSGSSDEVAALSSSQAPLTFLARMKSCALLNNVEGCLGVQKDLLMFLSKSKHSLHDIRQRGDDLVTCEYFEILLGMCVKSGRAQEARAAFRLLLDMRVRPSKTVCWQMLLRVYLPSNDLAGAISLAELCRQHSPLYSPFVDAIHAKVVRMIASQRGSRGQEAGEAAVTYIEGLLGSGATSSRLHAALVTELLKLGRVRPALASVERFLQLGEEEPSLLQESRYMDMAYMAVLDAIIKSVSISYSEKNRLIDQYIKSLVRGHVKTLPTYSLYTDYLIKDRNDIYVYIAMLHEMSLFFGQDSCSMWEVSVLHESCVYALFDVGSHLVLSICLCCRRTC